METLILNKLFNIICLLNLLTLLPESYGLLPDQNTKTWTFDLKSITSKTSDPEKLKVDLEITRISRGVYAISGEFLQNYDVFEGDSNYISGKCYRSSHGDNDYKISPFQMPPIHFYTFLNTFYKDLVMESLKNCSNLPYFEDKFVPPVEKKVYKVNGCQISHDGLPSHMQEGLYKTILTGTGDVDYEIELVTEIMNVL